MLASVVIKIEYRRAHHQDPVGILRQHATPSLPATKKLSISSFPAVFLPGSDLRVECDVTCSKQKTATFLPGATTARKPASRERLLRSHQGAFGGDFVCSEEFLTGSDPHSKVTVTNSKQTTGEFLTGARTAFKPFIFSRNFGAGSFAPTAKSPAQSRPY